MKQALILTAYNIYGRPLMKRYGVEDSQFRIQEALEEMAGDNDVVYIKIDGNCYVRKFHHEEAAQ